ncbi:hypothetical protein KIW84_043771 [Lathyrus oleraceus]|uniref:Reverse transcriptase/retrotransposon-derived protein RNase H-like domain-containing protein n=1 Tax=Pisum sativum TaxID=3888 RepID=A0A9D4XG36_PEA|nr:hypothetical protein KIW84_043771 [Pisum sativum]
MIATCAPIFKLLRKDQRHDWTEDFQKAFDSIKEYLSEPPILSLPIEGRPLIMYLTVLDDSMGCVLGQRDESGKKEYAIYYLSKKFTNCESRKDTSDENPDSDGENPLRDFTGEGPNRTHMRKQQDEVLPVTG